MANLNEQAQLFDSVETILWKLKSKMIETFSQNANVQNHQNIYEIHKTIFRTGLTDI